MAEKPPFLEDGSQYGISRTEFRRLRKADKFELMLQWFNENFEDPAENTPFESAEGGFQWIWGGPKDAREELYSQFGDIVPEAWIDEVANKIERRGTQWVPVQKVEDWEDIDWSDRFDEPASLDLYLDEPSPLYGSPEEREARDKARSALSRLESSLEKRRPVGIGHNQPPDEIDPPEVKVVRDAVRELKLEFSQPNPKISVVMLCAAPLRAALIACGKWTAKKLDKAADAAAIAIGTTIGAGIAGIILHQCFPSLHNAFDAIINWLDIAAKTLI
jgi:hypothetical protein